MSVLRSTFLLLLGTLPAALSATVTITATAGDLTDPLRDSTGHPVAADAPTFLVIDREGGDFQQLDLTETTLALGSRFGTDGRYTVVDARTVFQGVGQFSTVLQLDSTAGVSSGATFAILWAENTAQTHFGVARRTNWILPADGGVFTAGDEGPALAGLAELMGTAEEVVITDPPVIPEPEPDPAPDPTDDPVEDPVDVVDGSVDDPSPPPTPPTEEPAEPEPTEPPLVAASSQLSNLSSRAYAGPAEDQAIAGFVITGTAPKRLLLRTVGPALADFGVQDAITAPVLQLFHNGTRLAHNQGWSTAPDADAIVAAAARSGAFPLGESTADSALLVDLAPGAYTLLAGGAATETGTVLLEIYDTEPEANAAQLINLSTRARVSQVNANLTAGFVVTGTAPKSILVRGIGPGLATFGISQPLADPRITVYQNEEIVATNDDWSEDAATLEPAFATVSAFPLAPGSTDAALLLTLEPGAYTVQLSPTTPADGIALVEVYELP